MRGRERSERVRRRMARGFVRWGVGKGEAEEVRGRVVAPGGEKAGREEDEVVVVVGQGECELAVGS